MWKKDDETTEKPTRDAVEAAPKPTSGSARSGASAQTATIGSAIRIHGEVTGDEDLLIQGRVDGSIDLKEHAVTVGGDGQVTASITARAVTVEGRVDGDIRARERVVLRSSSQVDGDITSPRVVLEDGARFRGGVDMGEADASTSGGSRSGMSKSGGSSSSGDAGKTSSSSSSGSGGSSSGSGKGSSDSSSSSARSTAGAAGSSGTDKSASS